MTSARLPRISLTILVVAAALLPAACSYDDLLPVRFGAAAGINFPALVEIQPNIVYATYGDTTLHMDLYRPAYRPDPLPLVLIVHGGSWRSGSKDDMVEFAYDVAAHGMAAAAINYRLVQVGGTFPNSVFDVVDAASFLRDHASEWGIDRDRVGVLGVSAGAHLALMAGMVDDLSKLDPARPAGRPFEFRAIVNIEGPTDFTQDPANYTERQISLVEGFLGKRIDDPDGARRRLASPITYARQFGPPVLTIHGIPDTTVFFTHAQRLESALEAAGQAHSLIPIQGMDHIPGALWVGPFVQGYREQMLAFLRDQLK